MRAVLHAEWTKLRTVAGPAWLLLATVALTVGVSALVSAAAQCQSGACAQDPGKVSFAGVQIGQATVAVLAVLVISGEYNTGMVRTTLAAMPRRWEVLAAKAAAVAALTLTAGSVSVLGSLLSARLTLPHSALPVGAITRAAAGSVLYLALIALLSVGIATVARDPAPAIGAVLGLIYLFPLLAQVVPDATLQRHLLQIGPMSAGLAVQAIRPGSVPIGPWAGLGVLAGWAAAALLAGEVLLERRDA